MLAFYQTDLGKKTIAATPSITRDGAAIGQQWAEANMPRVLEALVTSLKADVLFFLILQLPRKTTPARTPKAYTTWSRLSR
jgi:hypothetical protein